MSHKFPCASRQRGMFWRRHVPVDAVFSLGMLFFFLFFFLLCSSKVRVVRGSQKGAQGKVTACYRKKYIIHIDRLNFEKKNGMSVPLGFNASKVCVCTLVCFAQCCVHACLLLCVCVGGFFFFANPSLLSPCAQHLCIIVCRFVGGFVTGRDHKAEA